MVYGPKNFNCDFISRMKRKRNLRPRKKKIWACGLKSKTKTRRRGPIIDVITKDIR